MTGSRAARRRIAATAALLVLSTAGFMVLALAYVDGGTVVDADVDVSAWVADRMPGWAELLARPFSWVGGVGGIAFVTVAAVAVLRVAQRRLDALFLVAVAVGAGLLPFALKQVYERARPETGSAVPLPHSYSFPSGHAASGLAVFGALAVLAAGSVGSVRARLAVVLVGLALALGIGASRVILNVHYVSDVLAGFCVGGAWLAACLLVRELSRGRAA